MKIPNEMFDGDDNINKIPPEQKLNNDVETDDDVDNEPSGMSKWVKIGLITLAVIIAMVAIVGVKSWLAPTTNNKASTSQSMPQTNNSKIKKFVESQDKKESTKSKDSVTQSSVSNDSVSKPSSADKAPSTTKDSTTAVESTTKDTSTIPPVNTETTVDVTNTQSRIQSSLPNLTVGDTQLNVKSNASVKSEMGNDGIQSTLSVDGTPFAIITTKDNTDSLKLLAGYQAYASEIKNSK